MKRSLKWLATLAVVLLFGLGWWAFARVEQPTAPRNLDDEALEIGAMLRCPICQNVSVAFSPSQLAVQMRGVIRQKLEAGETREQIIQYFVDRYGESILLEPPKRAQRAGLVIAFVDLNRTLQLAPSCSERFYSSQAAVGLGEQREIHSQPEMTLDSIPV